MSLDTLQLEPVSEPESSLKPTSTYTSEQYLITVGSPISHFHISEAYIHSLSTHEQPTCLPQDTIIFLVLDSSSIPAAGFHTIPDLQQPSHINVNYFWFKPGCSLLPAILARALWHSLWTHCAQFLTIDNVPPEIAKQLKSQQLQILNDKTTQTESLTISAKDFCHLSNDAKKAILSERAYLASHFSSPKSSCQIIFDHPYHAKYRDMLIQNGVVTRSILKEMLAEAKKCGYSDDVNKCLQLQHPFVYLPWRNSLTRIIAPDIFHKTRLDRNRYKMTLPEIYKLREKVIGVIGMSVGASIALCIAQQGLCGELRIADFDNLELSNLNRVQASFLNIGANKVDVARQRIAEIDPYLSVSTFASGISSENVRSFVQGLSIVVEECDSFDIKLMIREQAREFRIPVVMETTDNGVLDVERYDLIENLSPFHGLLGSLSSSELAGFSREQLIGFLGQILDLNNLSTRMGASVLEMGGTLSSWPQLAEDIALGTALVAGACRRILLELPVSGGRWSQSIDNMVTGVKKLDVEQNVPAPLKKRMPLPENDLKAIETAAHVAPSGGNAQPWHVEIDDRCVSVSLRDDITSTIIDWKWRASLVGCGAALCNAWCVAAQRGRVTQPDKLCVQFASDTLEQSKRCGEFLLGTNTGIYADLGNAVIDRVSNRRNVKPGLLSDQVVDSLHDIVKPFGVRLVYVPASEVDTDILRAFAISSRVRFFCEQTHKELFQELRDGTKHDSLSFGLDLRTLELSELDNAALGILRNYSSVRLLRDWNLGSRLADLSSKGLKGCDGILFCIINGPTKTDYVRAGFALEATLLKATLLKVGINIIWPLFGGAHNKEDLGRMVGETYGKELWEAKLLLENRLRLENEEGFLCCIRLLQAESPSAISQRCLPT